MVCYPKHRLLKHVALSGRHLTEELRITLADSSHLYLPDYPNTCKHVVLQISAIQRNAGTQGRLSLNLDVVDEYAALMMAGVEFPPVRTLFDGDVYYLTDGFHRLAAVEKLRRNEILAEVFEGTLSDALWDSCGANATHGLRRSRPDIEAIIRRALTHPNRLALSNNQIATHLGIPEATLRRWRKRLSSPSDDNRVATRNGTTYTIDTKQIGRHSTPRSSNIRPKSIVKRSLSDMKAQASPEARRLLNILANWLLGRATDSACLLAIEKLLGEWTRKCE